MISPYKFVYSKFNCIFAPMNDADRYAVNPCKYIYHRDIGFPKTINIQEKWWKLSYTDHAKDRLREKYNGLKFLPEMVKVNKYNVVEVHTNDNKHIKKVLVRTHLNKKSDIILVLELKYKIATVITFYINSKQDTHKDFDKTKYTNI